jgi:hypothetical protein
MLLIAFKDWIHLSAQHRKTSVDYIINPTEQWCKKIVETQYKCIEGQAKLHVVLTLTIDGLTGRKEETSPESMEEYIWLERITVLLDLCRMQ